MSSKGTAISVSGAQLAFGTAVDSVNLQASSYLALCLILAGFSAILAIVAAVLKNKKGVIVTSAISALISGIIMLVAVLSKVSTFVDSRPLVLAETAAYSSIVWILTAMLLLSAIIGVAAWLITDYMEVLASKGQKLSIPKKIKKFFREMIAEIRKIVWPDAKGVARNSVIVLIMCLLVGAYIWVIDYLLGLLLKFITTL